MELSLKERDRIAVMRQVGEGRWRRRARRGWE